MDMNITQQNSLPESVEQQSVPVSANNVYEEICEQIVREQYQIIGSLAFEQAKLVSGLHIDPVTFQCVITGNGTLVVEEIINKYRDFFGNAAVEVCKEAAARFLVRLPKELMPASLAS